MLPTKDVSLQTYLFTFTSIGNASSLTPAYGANELVISSLMTAFLFWSVAAFKRDVKNDDANQVSHCACTAHEQMRFYACPVLKIRCLMQLARPCLLAVR